MKTDDAARRWAQTWQRGWNELDTDAVVALYSTNATLSSEPFREPYIGREGVRSYVSQVFAEEEAVDARFGEPIAGDGRAAVPWWATLVEDGAPITLAGTSLLRFGDDGLEIEQWDTWNQANEQVQEKLP